MKLLQRVENNGHKKNTNKKNHKSEQKIVNLNQKNHKSEQKKS